MLNEQWRFNSKSKVLAHKEKYSVLLISHTDSLLLNSIISPLIIDDMKYKIPRINK